MRVKMLLAVFSLVMLSGCPFQAHLPVRPDSDVCILNSKLQQRRCWNMIDDYDENGKILPGHPGFLRPMPDLDHVNKMTCFDSKTGPADGAANFKTYINQMRDTIVNVCNKQSPFPMSVK